MDLIFFIDLFDVIVELKNIIYRTEQCESQNRLNLSILWGSYARQLTAKINVIILIIISENIVYIFKLT